MTGTTEDRLDDLNGQIAALKVERTDQVLLVEARADRSQDVTEDTMMLREIEARIATLQACTATFERDPR
ncbi:hypothetical protein [Methylobacterium soli]|uniref:Uncharacterized protein n=1 Tax=Methylobacterium soli TaxID=553447 RepID=A0A6L3SNH1_9HYPH|nr:hypothetical protein [Methylobacterium soli]KAB1068846.1 hypothetical protein F6X53_31335 [Methylobacterium soli]GJE46852.1 hypothetical protein AEGHOMDF_6061 [Methylobacterium soli]